MTSRNLGGIMAVAWVLAMGLARAAPVYAQATTSRIVSMSPWTVTLDPTVTPEYACLPEKISLAGAIRSQVTKTTDATGAVHYTHQLIPNQVVGIGLSTGTKYRAVGTHYHSGEVLHGGPEPDPNGPFHLAAMQNFYVIGHGRGTDFMLHILSRITINANGQAHAFVNQVRIECR